MTLAEYIEAEDLTLTQFAVMIGKSVSTVSRIVRGEHVPEFETMLTIDRVTKGRVTPNDFRPAPRQPERCDA